MFYVYILKSKRFPQKIYIGFTKQLLKRLSQHNRGESKYTKPFRPWNIIYYESYLSKKDARRKRTTVKAPCESMGTVKA